MKAEKMVKSSVITFGFCGTEGKKAHPLTAAGGCVLLMMRAFVRYGMMELAPSTMTLWPEK